MRIKKLLQSETRFSKTNVYYSKVIAGFISFLLVWDIFSFEFGLSGSYILTKPNLLWVVISIIITFYIHEAGHYIWGYLTGGKVEFFCNQNNLYIARIRKFTRLSLIAFSLGGPLTNLLFGIFSLLILLLNINLLFGEFACVFSFLNLVCGIGALIPISSKRGGLLYYNYISNT